MHKSKQHYDMIELLEKKDVNHYQYQLHYLVCHLHNDSLQYHDQSERKKKIHRRKLLTRHMGKVGKTNHEKHGNHL
jgi:hypothetical protein